MSTVTTATSIFGSFFDSLVTEGIWTQSVVNEAISLINGSQSLVSQLIDLSDDGQGWQIIYQTGTGAATDIGAAEIVDSDVNAGAAANGTSFDQAEIFVGSKRRMG